jgi:ADP-glucose pyrophosphorylase
MLISTFNNLMINYLLETLKIFPYNFPTLHRVLWPVVAQVKKYYILKINIVHFKENTFGPGDSIWPGSHCRVQLFS